jgi:transposase
MPRSDVARKFSTEPFVFITNRSAPYTNNVSERHLRPSVIFRKVTNWFRCEWGTETYAALRSLVTTAKANRTSMLGVLRFLLTAKPPVELG